MIDVMETLQQYVPIQTSFSDVADLEVYQILFRGDQLTAVHARGCAELRINSDTGTGKLDTLIPVVEDWHTLLTLITVCYCI